ncbi:ABC transporter permease [Atrimonas thermophila]|uniref:ABC transporter permease n=1 Tax=Atrimonas thermophila TaxID=3064161 RepID=UPI00399C5EAE
MTLESLAGIVTVASELGIVACGVTILMISGEVDLSVGSVFGFSAMIFASLSSVGFYPFIGFLIALLVACIIGLGNGLITVRFRIPSFITTLGTMMLWRGVLLAWTGGFGARYTGKSVFLNFLNGQFLGEFRASALWFIFLIAVFSFILTKTPYGNFVYATGGNREAARLLGIPVDRVKVINFMIVAVLSGLAGCIQFARFASVDPLRGQGMELEAIAATVVGGTLMSGGQGSLIGTLFGVLLIGMVRSGLVMSGAPAYWYQAFIGVILIVAVIINTKLREWTK